MWIWTASARITAEVESGAASAGVAVVAETANASPGASRALSRSRALRAEQQHTAPTRCLGLATRVLLSGEVNQQSRHAGIVNLRPAVPSPSRKHGCGLSPTRISPA